MLDDECSDYRSVQEFYYDTFEATIGLANDGDGITDRKADYIEGLLEAASAEDVWAGTPPPSGHWIGAKRSGPSLWSNQK